MSEDLPAPQGPDRKEDVIVWNATVARIAPARRKRAGAEKPRDSEERALAPPSAEGSAPSSRTTE
ncbi:MAG TPA: hypothetical protein VK915_12130 [Gaiellaceae bacterium]|nr:hypothetical protein [Gaiellaceae bacterium]